MKKPLEDRAKAELSFVEEGKSYREIADELKVVEKTIWRWSQEGNWIRKRRVRQFETPHPELDALKRQLALQVAEMGSKELATPEEIEALHKLSQVVERMETRLQPEVGPLLDTMGRFARFVASHADDEACETLRIWVEKFLDDECRRNS